MHKKQPTHGNPNSSLMASSAIKVAIGLALIVVVLATVGKLVQEWGTVLWLVSLGGRFWGAVSVGLIGLAFTAWAWLITFAMTQREGPTASGASERKTVLLRWLIATQIAGTAIFIVANIALSGSYDSFSQLNIYQRIAVVAMHGSLFFTVALVFCILVSIVDGDD
ncbi:hypothetical protein [Achromobacter sp.]|uniref:hypothetical protein n=1 Tax=Achromobacter sp. TaxID=134375 RepID=UPI0028AF82F4|nr:hypothetical protein [Achromobacter sp.]